MSRNGRRTKKKRRKTKEEGKNECVAVGVFPPVPNMSENEGRREKKEAKSQDGHRNPRMPAIRY
jgi:hypothetical protein